MFDNVKSRPCKCKTYTSMRLFIKKQLGGSCNTFEYAYKFSKEQIPRHQITLYAESRKDWSSNITLQ